MSASREAFTFGLAGGRWNASGRCGFGFLRGFETSIPGLMFGIGKRESTSVSPGDGVGFLTDPGELVGAVGAVGGVGALGR